MKSRTRYAEYSVPKDNAPTQRWRETKTLAQFDDLDDSSKTRTETKSDADAGSQRHAAFSASADQQQPLKFLDALLESLPELQRVWAAKTRTLQAEAKGRRERHLSEFEKLHAQEYQRSSGPPSLHGLRSAVMTSQRSRFSDGLIVDLARAVRLSEFRELLRMTPLGQQVRHPSRACCDTGPVESMIASVLPCVCSHTAAAADG